MKIIVFLSILFLSAAVVPAQTSFLAVADVDSFTYVSTTHYLLTLQRDQNNELKFVDSVKMEIPGEFSDCLNSSVIMNNFLFVTKKDSIFLFSIQDKQHPVLMDRFQLAKIDYLKNFGPYIVAMTANSDSSALLKVENDSIKIVKKLPYSNNSLEFFNEYYWISFNYPYFYQINNTATISRYVYSEEDNEFYLVYTTLGIDNTTLNAIYASGDYVYFVASIGQLPNNTVYIKRYNAENDSMYIDDNFYYLRGSGIPSAANWRMTNSYSVLGQSFYYNNDEGIVFYKANVASASWLNLCQVSNNSVYQSGNKFYYLYDKISDSLIFKQFTMPPTGINEENSVPGNFVLEQNFPNPFNPSTKISFTVAKPGWVTLKVYDFLGREVAVLMDEEKDADNYTVDFNAKNLSSGVYYYQIKTDNFTQTKKMLLLK